VPAAASRARCYRSSAQYTEYSTGTSTSTSTGTGSSTTGYCSKVLVVLPELVLELLEQVSRFHVQRYKWYTGTSTGTGTVLVQ
jgi:3D (Asp-Asp-Asp) domain-containing protein